MNRLAGGTDGREVTSSAIALLASALLPGVTNPHTVAR